MIGNLYKLEGYGVRSVKEVTPWFEDIIQVIRDVAPKVPIAFNTAPETCIDAAKRRFPLPA